MKDQGEKATVSPTQSRCDWHSIDWASAIAFVRKLRQEIFRATKEGDLGKVRTLQRIMLRSYENRVMAVRQVTQTNRGKNTPGVDKVVLKTPEARGKLVDRLAHYELWKPLPARRVYIPKANGSQRPLGIPAITDRAVQAMVKNALEPFWEARFEDSSYGFRPGRSCHDALSRAYMHARASGTRRWVLDADIKGAFDNIGHDKLMEVIGNFPARELIRQWLKAGYLDDGVYHDTDSGTPQGGVISPLLANIAFHGMEESLGVRYHNWDQSLHKKSVGLVRYADDFLVFCHTHEEAEEAKRKLAAWFRERGLCFSDEKTRIVHLEEGFDFLSFNVRLYKVLKSKTGYRLLMRPAKKAVIKYARELKKTFRESRGNTADLLCVAVNRKMRGWVQYFRHGVASRVFQKLDAYLFELQWRWARWEHSKRGKQWRRKRYWGRVKADRADNWTFHGQKSHMRKHSWTPIKRHVMVRRFASVDDPDLEGYWAGRKAQEAINSLTDFQRAVAERQKWVCPVCSDWIMNGEEWHEHRVIPGREGGRYTCDNVRLVHLFCHQVEHRGKRKTARDDS